MNDISAMSKNSVQIDRLITLTGSSHTCGSSIPNQVLKQNLPTKSAAFTIAILPETVNQDVSEIGVKIASLRKKNELS
jgi:hypothetical protein